MRRQSIICSSHYTGWPGHCRLARRFRHNVDGTAKDMLPHKVTGRRTNVLICTEITLYITVQIGTVQCQRNHNQQLHTHIKQIATNQRQQIRTIRTFSLTIHLNFKPNSATIKNMPHMNGHSTSASQNSRASCAFIRPCNSPWRKGQNMWIFFGVLSDEWVR